MNQNLFALKSLPADLAGCPNGLYAVKQIEPNSVEAEDSEIASEVWFKTPPLDKATIKRISKIQLFAESRDQGYADDESAGNWTWFELAILDSASATEPRVIDEVELVYRSHFNRFLTEEYDWAEGEVFGKEHALIGLLRPGNVIAVRLCARFAGWKIMAKTGVLTIELEEPSALPEVPNFKAVLENVKAIQEIFDETNIQINAAYQPQLPQSIRRADSFVSAGERGLRVLSLDGGGVRGLSSLYLLKEVMKLVSPDGHLKPCDVFDMIGGTSTGGLIAIMLGRLRMDVDTCIQKYEEFMSQVFKTGFFGKKGNFLKTGFFYDADVLEKLIKEIVGKEINDADAKLLHDDSRCRVFVTAVRSDAANNREPVLLRSYQNENNRSLLPDCLVWQAARATSAAPAYFKPITVGQYELIDGGLGANNPLGWLWNEVLDVFGPARRTACFLSIGTGIPANKALGKAGVFNEELAEGLSSIATNTQLTHVLFKSILNAYAPDALTKKYWRLNVGEPIPEHDETEETGMLWWKKVIVVHKLDNYKDVGDLDALAKLDILREMTRNYIAAQSNLIAECADALKASL